MPAKGKKARGLRKFENGLEANKMARNLDALAEFEQFQADVLPALRKDLAAGMSAEALYKKYQSMAAARNITIAATSQNEGTALAAIKDILDRAGGKAKERSEVTHKMQNVPDDQLDALIMSKLGLTKEQAENKKKEDLN